VVIGVICIEQYIEKEICLIRCSDKHAARRFLRRLLDNAGQKPLRMTTDKHPGYTKAIRWIVGRKVLHRHNQYFNNRIEQDHRSIEQRYYPMLGFAKFESASRFCNAFDELRNYLRVGPWVVSMFLRTVVGRYSLKDGQL
jgi:transposase-like protein